MTSPDSDTRVTELKGGSDDRFVVAGRTGGEVTVWDVEGSKELLRIQTNYDIPGDVEFSASRRRCLVATYAVHGLCCYGMDGRLAWQRKDLKRNQGLAISPDGDQVFFFSGSGPCDVVSVLTGETQARLRGVRHVWFSTDATLQVRQTAQIDVTDADGKRLARLTQDKVGGDRLVDACFSGGLVATSGDGLRFVEIASGRELLRYEAFVGRVAALGDTGEFVGAMWDFMTENRTPNRLLHFSPRNGSVEVVADFRKSYPMTFCLGGRRLVIRYGEVIDTSTGGVVGQLDFASRGEEA